MVRLLVISPTCDANDVGEAWVAYQWAHRLAKRHDVTLLTYHKRDQKPASEQLKGLRVVEWSEPPGLGRAERLNSMLKPGYVPFYVRARHWVRQALKRGEHFELAHQPVPVAMRYPCPVVGLGIPFVIGPVGGSLESPAAFVDEEGGAAWWAGLRSFDRLLLRANPWLRRTYEQAAHVLGIAPYVEEHLRGVKVSRFSVLSETALEDLPAPVDRTAHTGEVRLLHVGRLVRTKGARDTIRAMALLRDLPVGLDIIGDGYDRAACEALVAELGMSGRVRFQGRLPRAEIDDFYRRADIFVFPSYREPGGNVTFEAMGYGLPLVVCDRGGPGAVVDDSCGIRVPAVSPAQLAADVAAAIRRLVLEPDLRAALGAKGRQRVAKIGLWDRKIEQIDSVYRQVLSAQPDRNHSIRP
jgi:glycosyltransferase involved in cell wall biosynthesis